MHFKLKYILVVFALILSANVSAQKTKRQQLEERRIQLQKDKVYINGLLSSSIRKEKNLLVELLDIEKRIDNSEKLISIISRESKELSNEIYLNQLEINQNRRDLEVLKDDYAKMIYKSYKSKSQNSRIMFLLSSENFFQAYKRFQYMKQYTSFRKQQGEDIKLQTIEVENLVGVLKNKKIEKLELLEGQQEEQKTISEDKKKQQVLLSQIKEKEGKYNRQIKAFLKEEKKIDAQIDKIIKDAIAASIAASNARSGKKPSSGKTEFVLTVESKILGDKFIANKGKLPWPVEKGFVSMYYGKQRHPIVKTATIQSNGVRIATQKGSKARAVFNGTVLAVQVMSGNKKAVLIQHGNYITVYKNLQNVTVKTGEKITTKQAIGTIFTDKVTGKTILSFVLTKNSTTENPKNWIYKM